ncbi:hypothetical protein QQZ08_008830 [Neonectria magnoliae]|uniref:Uncharacterized protein n=1 Tax=Neonectria magnoliae TaxID=2732573 RepID=A0ABR1HTU1_9HYPO
MKFWSFLRALLLVALLATEASAYAKPGACSGQCWSHDPSVIRRDGDGVYFRFETGSLIRNWKASALTGPWVHQGAAVPKESVFNLTGNDDLWTDHGATGVASDSCKPYNAIDGNLIADQSGNYCLNFGSFWGDI